MTGPSYHARTHLPGGSDPLTISGGAVITATAQVSTPFTWGPGSTSRNLDTILTNDPTVFSNRPSFPHEILIQHGGVMRFDAAIEFATSLGGPYAGIFDAVVTLRDSAGADVDEISGPIIYYSELYATSGVDNFRLSGTTLFNADDTFFTPPYHTFITWENAVNSVATSAQFTVSILNPTGLT